MIYADDNVPVSREYILNTFRNRCVLCGHPARVPHEIVPKSQDPVGWRKFGNRVPLCVDCHVQVHADGASLWESKLRERRTYYLELFR